MRAREAVKHRYAYIYSRALENLCATRILGRLFRANVTSLPRVPRGSLDFLAAIFFLNSRGSFFLHARAILSLITPLFLEAYYTHEVLDECARFKNVFLFFSR